MKCPQYVEVDNKRYKINTSYKAAIECNRIATDNTIGDFERALAVIYTLFGDEGLSDKKHHEQLLKLAQRYLSCGKEIENTEEPDMDYIEDMDLIEASFMSDFHIDLTKEDMDWYKFNNLINGLSSSELGNSCVLNRVRAIRNFDLSTIKDRKEKEKMAKLKKQVELKKNKAENHLTKEQEESMEKLNKMLGL